MPQTTFVYIQERGSPASRVQELTGVSVRVGAGSQCEVRLPSPTRPEVVCVLRRRGDSWSVQPLGPPGPVAVGGIPIERPRVLPLDVPLRVGDHVLTLHAAQPDATRPGSFTDPIPLVPESIDFGPTPGSDAPAASEPPAAAPHRDRAEVQVPVGEEERLARWQASLERRERWLKARREEREWERRWRAAGERLRARSSGVSGGPAPFAPEAAPRPRPRRAPEPTRPSRPSQSEASPPEGPPTPSDPPTPPRLGAVTRLRPPDEGEPAPSMVPPAPKAAPEVEPGLIALLDPDDLAARLAWERSGEPVSIDATFVAAPTAAPQLEPPPEVVRPPDPERIAPGPPTSPSAPTEPSAAPPRIDRIAEEPAWPSARSILESQRVDPRRVAMSWASSGRRPAPTEAREPAQWSLPAWAVVPTMLALTVVLGGLGLALAWTWAQDDRIAGVLADRLLSDQPVPAVGLEVEPPPSPTWWGSTADHLLARAVALGRVAGDPAREDQARFLIGLALNASPLHAGARYARLSVPLEGERPAGEEADLARLSRDHLALALAARRRLDEGRADEALELYRQALAMATDADPAHAARPAVDEEGRGRRSPLPNEDLLVPILLDMTRSDGWDVGTWIDALPDSSLALLSASRVLRDRGEAESGRLLGRILDRPPPVGHDLRAAVEHAARAEAAALLDRWEEAERGYLEALRHTEDPGWRRLWWRNLADVYRRLDDLDRMRAARAHAETGAPFPARSAIPEPPGRASGPEPRPDDPPRSDLGAWALPSPRPRA